MAVNLAVKYSDQIAEVFTAGSFIKGKTSTSFDLTGVKTLIPRLPCRRWIIPVRA